MDTFPYSPRHGGATADSHVHFVAHNGASFKNSKMSLFLFPVGQAGALISSTVNSRWPNRSSTTSRLAERRCCPPLQLPCQLLQGRPVPARQDQLQPRTNLVPPEKGFLAGGCGFRMNQASGIRPIRFQRYGARRKCRIAPEPLFLKSGPPLDSPLNIVMPKL